jgi:pyruvate ferredoxin oxidoreductase alpha subunit
VEEIAKFVNDGELDAELIYSESEHSMLSSAIGASAIGVRVFTATSSQGLAYAFENLFIASGLRLPIVMAVANRTLSSPINIWNDIQDSISARDSGWLQFYAESSQESFDTIIQAYKIAEQINLPVMVCVDGFTLSHMYEPVEILEQKQVDSFLPEYKPKFILDPKKPITMGPVAYPNTFMQFKKQQQEAMLNSIKIIKKVNNEFKNKFKRSYGNGLIETYNLKNKKAIIAMGSVCGTIREFCDKNKVGLIKIRCFRPFPKQELINTCKNLKELIVIDKDISIGNEGALAIEVKSVLHNKKIKSFIMGLGGKDITLKDLEKTLKNKEGWIL